MDNFVFRRADSSNFDGQINLLDVVSNSKESQKNIHTFQEFKQWFNNFNILQTEVRALNWVSKIKSPEGFQLIESAVKINKPSTNLIQSNNYGQNQLLISSPILNLGNMSMKRKMSVSNNPFQFQQKENSIRQSSAHSSRSFNGYQQINQYELRQKLGKGAFSQVYLAIDVEDEQKKKYAIKIMESKHLKKKFFRKNSQFKQSSNDMTSKLASKVASKRDKDEDASQFVNNQIAILKKINHQNITHLHEVIIDRQKGKAYLVLEYCDKGFINQSQDKSKGQYRKLLQSQCKRYYKQLSLAVNYIHTVVKIAHRDIKPQNVLISDHDQIKLSDFGLGTYQMESQKHSGTKLYMPPQSTNTKGSKLAKTQSADIWAMGVTLLIMLMGKTPQYKDGQLQNLDSIIQSLKDVSKQLKDFIRKCLQKDPQKRMTSEDLLSHPWLATGENGFSPFLMIQRSLVKQFEFIVTEQQKKQAVTDVQIRKKRQNVLSLNVLNI